eukprot:gb/GEZN01004329.1/.p1 GENE.gb/GEZN01004329.1/~~gb/GEZN01004329.1/.p1  ORF type:complete len:553 (+),score=85.03 gb/GEZN01004329.1/:44-1702(+)
MLGTTTRIGGPKWLSACSLPTLMSRSFYNTYLGKDLMVRPRPGKTTYAMTKIVATIGPVSEQKEMLETLVRQGITCMRLNFSHCTLAEAELREVNLRNAPGKHSNNFGLNFNMRSIMLDTQGPEVRTGCIADNKKLHFEAGMHVLLTNNEEYKMNCTTEVMYITYPNLAATAKVGSRVHMNDGVIGMTIVALKKNGDVECVVDNSGIIGNKRGVNIPNTKLDLPAMSVKDRKDVKYAVERDFDFVACSFVKTGSDVAAIKNFIAWQMEDLWPKHHLPPLVIAKIETAEALRNFEEILTEADGIMVARGDLGVEIPMEQVANVQKEIVTLCNKVGKPVIVATQMLDSMQSNPRPTRAEVSDVTNAIYDGADAVMLSGETANGKFPKESVDVMNKVIIEAEKLGSLQRFYNMQKQGAVIKFSIKSKERAIAESAVLCAHEVGASCIIVLTNTGFMARLISHQRPLVPVVCLVSSEKLGRQLSLYRGLFPIKASTDIIGHALKDEGLKVAQKAQFCTRGEKVVVVSVEPIVRSEDVVGTTITQNSSIAVHVIDVE